MIQEYFDTINVNGVDIDFFFEIHDNDDNHLTFNINPDSWNNYPDTDLKSYFMTEPSFDHLFQLDIEIHKIKPFKKKFKKLDDLPDYDYQMYIYNEVFGADNDEYIHIESFYVTPTVENILLISDEKSYIKGLGKRALCRAMNYK